MDMFSADTLKAWSVDTLAAKSAQLLMAKRLRWSSSLAIQLWPLAPMGCSSLKHQWTKWKKPVKDLHFVRIFLQASCIFGLA